MSPVPVEKIEFIRPAALQGLEVLSAENCLRDWKLYHENYVICPVMDGTAEWAYRGRRRVSRRGIVMLMEPGECHKSEKAGGAPAFKAMFLSRALLGGLSEEDGGPAAPHWRTAEALTGAFQGAFFRLFSAISHGGSPLEQQSRLAQCVRLFLDRCSEQPVRPRAHPSKRRLHQVRSRLTERFAEKVTLDELAAAAGLSRFHLLHSFIREFGLPPHVYQLQIRMLRAKELLKKGLPPAGLDVGFADQSHFIRHFKKTWGVTPGRYAEMVRRPFSGG